MVQGNNPGIDNAKRVISVFVLLAACAFTLAISLPTINQNIDDPNMIVYFNNDEGWLMDLMWSYYSGQRRDSFQGDFDTGLLLQYFADMNRLVTSRFIQLTPGMLVVMMRWLNLISWMAAFFALWHLVRYHFGTTWQPAIAVSLLAVRPAFGYLSNNMKPEPFILLMLIIGLHFVLKVIDRPSRLYLMTAVVFASAAFLIKYAGIFLLFPILASVLISKEKILPDIRMPWAFPLIAGALLTALPLSSLFFYQRKSSGMTVYGQYGFIEGLLMMRPVLFLVLTGLSLVIVSALVFIANKSHIQPVVRLMGWFGRLSNYLFMISVMFLGLTALIGFKFVIDPRYFILKYSQMFPTFLGSRTAMVTTTHNVLYGTWTNILSKISALDPVVVLLFVFYISVELFAWKTDDYRSDNRKRKRIVLLSFLLPLIPIVLSMGRIENHHILPFFVTVSILALQGVALFMERYRSLRSGSVAVAVIVILILVDLLTNGSALVRSRISQFGRSDDIAYTVSGWMKSNIPFDSVIVADHYTRVYIPNEYSNVKTLNWNQHGRARQLRNYVDDLRPAYLYLNIGTPGENDTVLPPVRDILPYNVETLRIFDGKSAKYRRWPDDKYAIYKVIYQ